MSHNFSEKFLLNEIDNYVQLTDFKGGIQMLEELKKIPALIIPKEFVGYLLGHLFFIKGKVLVGD
jgi:hypothetical protein